MLICDPRPAKSGWAPGSYENICCACHKQYIGEKYSILCSDCVYIVEKDVDIDTNSLQYSKNIPTKEGYYWLLEGELEEIVEVFTRPGHKYLCILDPNATYKRNFLAVNNLPYLWAGPINKPLSTDEKTALKLFNKAIKNIEQQE